MILIHGKHSLKFGVDFRRMQRNFYQSQAPAGQFTFTGQFTQNQATGDGGNTIADLLLGLPIYREQDGLAGKDPTRYWELGEFVQDDYRVTNKLTLNLGFRYDVFSPVGGKIGNFDLSRAVLVNNYGPNAVPNAGVKFDLSDVGPAFWLRLQRAGQRQKQSSAAPLASSIRPRAINLTTLAKIRRCCSTTRSNSRRPQRPLRRLCSRRASRRFCLRSTRRTRPDR